MTQQNINLLSELSIPKVSTFNSKFIVQIAAGWLLFLFVIYLMGSGVNIYKQHRVKKLETTQKTLSDKIEHPSYQNTKMQSTNNPELKNLPRSTGSLIGFYGFFEDLAMYTPEAVWLNTIILSQDDNSVTFKGNAIVASGVSEFVKALSKSTSFSNKKFNTMELEKQPNSSNIDFILSTSVINPVTTLDKKE